MQCENIFCIYWSKQGCTLPNISLDIQGNCNKCIYIDINEEWLKSERQKSLRRYNKDDKKY